jgi:adenine-specific DNA-methyltransferase
MFKTEGIAYMGSKKKLLPYLYNELKDYKNILDGFSGTTRVSQMISKFAKVTANDLSSYSYIFGITYLKEHNENKLLEIINYLNSLEGHYGWYSKHYGGNEELLEKGIKRPFRLHNTLKLDTIRMEIDKLFDKNKITFNEKCVLLTSLILGLDKVSNTFGHYSSYYNGFSKRSYNNLILKLPLINKFKIEGNVLQEDIFNIKNDNFDCVYLDPPYGSNSKIKESRVRYQAYYHIWETIVKNDKPEVFGKANRRVDSSDKLLKSELEKTSQKKSMEKLLNKFDCDIILSYNTNGSLKKEELLEICNQKGKVKIMEIDYKKNIMHKLTSNKKLVPSYPTTKSGKPHFSRWVICTEAPKFRACSTMSA